MLQAIWFAPPALLTIAEQRGLTARHGVAFAARRTGSSDEQLEALVAGRCDVAVTAMDNVIGWNRRDTGWDFRIVAQIETTTSLSLVARPHLDTPADLAGRTLLVDSAENGFVVVLLALLADSGLDTGANRLVQAGGVRERSERLIAGDGDATLLGPPFDGLAQAAGMRCLARIDHAYPTFPGQGVVVRQAALERLGGEITAWLRLLDAARASARADLQRAHRDLAAAGVPNAAIDPLIAGIGDTLVPDPAGIALLVAQRARLGLPGAGSTYETLVDTRCLAAAALTAGAHAARHRPDRKGSP